MSVFLPIHFIFALFYHSFFSFDHPSKSAIEMVIEQVEQEIILAVAGAAARFIC